MNASAEALLGAGLTLEAAGDLAISVHTARAQLKSVFGRTDTNRQAELAALLARVPRPPWDSD